MAEGLEIDQVTMATMMGKLIEVLGNLRQLAKEQAKDPGLWFEAPTPTAQEAYLQQELRKLHQAIEALGKVELG